MDVMRSRRIEVSRTRIDTNLYAFGNTARQLETVPSRKREEEHRKQLEQHVHGKSHHLSRGYVIFMTMAMLVTSAVLILYVRMQSDLTNSIKHISALESELNDLRLTNDEEYSRIESSVNLEEVKRVAIDELGMTYAKEGQVIDYSSENSDYVRQVADIPE